jgi:Icc-related predicted phosphoesterase
MKICALSDLHGTLLPVEDYFEPCELVCICGDIVPLNIQTNNKKTMKWLVNKFKPWCESLPCDKVIFIAGNHDFGFSNLDFMYTLFPKDKKVTYLFHENYIYTSKSGKEYSIFGTPYCKLFGNWAYMESDSVLDNLFKDIPENLDILLTHDQPYGWGDILLDDVIWNTGDHIGNKPLTKAVMQKQPKYMFTAHLHSTTHECVEIGTTKRYNVSIKNEKYDPVYNPLIINI